MTRRAQTLFWLLLALVLVGSAALFLIDAADRGRREVPLPLERPDVGEPTRRMDLEPAPPRSTTALREQPEGATIIGRILDVNRTPVAAARIELREGNPLGLAGSSRLPRLGSHRAEVSGDGQFALVGVPPVAELVVHVEGETFAARDAGPFAVAPGELVDVGDIVVEPGLLVHGMVFGPDAEPVPGARVALTEAFVRNGVGPGTVDPTSVAVTGADGRYAFRHVPHMMFNLVVEAEGYAGAVVEQSVVPERTRVQLGFDVQLDRPVPLHGSVVSAADDEPLVDVEVIAQPLLMGFGPGFTRTDDAGRFVFTNLLPGRYSVWCNVPGYSREGQLVVADEWHAGVNLRLDAAGRISGQVVTPAGEPVLAFDLQTLKANDKRTPGGPVGEFQRFRTTDGAFEVSDLEPGWYTFEVWSKGFPVTRSQPAHRVNRGAHLSGLVITMQPSATLTGRIVDDTSAPVVGAAVSLHSNRLPAIDFLRGGEPPAVWMRTVNTDKNGEFVFADVTENVYQLRFDHSSYPVTYRNDVAVVAGEETSVGVVTVPRPGALSGVVVDAAGVPQADANVSVSGPMDGEVAGRSVRANGLGRWTVNRLAPGPYIVRASPARPTLDDIPNMFQAEMRRVMAEREGVVERVTVAAGQTVEHVVRLD